MCNLRGLIYLVGIKLAAKSALKEGFEEKWIVPFGNRDFDGVLR